MALFVRRRWPLVAAAAVVVAALVALAVWLVAGRDSGPSAKPRDPLDVGGYETTFTPGVDPTEPSPTPAVAIEAVLTAPDDELRTYADQAVAATSVTVLKRVSPSVAWVGDSPANRVLLLLVATEHPFAFGPGARLTFTGSVRRAAPGTGQQLGLTGEELADFERQGTYVEVETYAEMARVAAAPLP
ncbi:MAG TPA: hypothetical protein VGX28_00815 [Frankiaceae bacterium]|jgi:hypothetical protein|nr:hypothetical protein [Frankiaceae bacterium]